VIGSPISNGEKAQIALGQLIAEGREIAEIEQILPSKLFDPDLWAASIAVGRYDHEHRERIEADIDEHMRAIRS
jgi:hypothetical protein